MNIKNKYKNIPGTIDISGKRTIRVLDQRDIPFNTKKFITIIGTCILVVIGMLFLTPSSTIAVENDTVQAKEVKEVVETQKVVKNDNVPERAFNLITKYEGFHDKPYWDFKQWSCGYGMKCSKNTKNITKEKSKQFVMERIDSIRERYKLHDIEDEIEVGLISFTYNIGHPPKGYRRYLNKGHIKALKYRMLEYSYAGGKFMRGLYKRRLDEGSFNN